MFLVSRLQIRAQESGHEHEGERIHVDGLNNRLITGFVELLLHWISLLYIVD